MLGIVDQLLFSPEKFRPVFSKHVQMLHIASSIFILAVCMEKSAKRLNFVNEKPKGEEN